MRNGESEVRRSKDGRAWRIGCDEEVAWIREGTEIGMAITSGIPPVFDAYATLELPGSGDHEVEAGVVEDQERHDAAVLGLLIEHSATQRWWLGYLETGASDLVFGDAPRVDLYAGWSYVLVEAGPEQAREWREDFWKGALPDVIFPVDRSWLCSTLWDDEWTCIGGPRGLVDGFLAHPELRGRVHEVDPSMEDATPPGHTAI